MKTRQGFVSNSSSSSFIIAVPNNATECECCGRSNHWLLQAIQTYLGTFTKDGNKFYPVTTAENIVEHFETKLNDLVNSKAYTEKQLATIIELQKDPGVYETYEKLKKQLERLRSKMSIEDEAKYGSESARAKGELAERKEILERRLAEYDGNVAHLQDLIKKVKEYLNKDFTVYSFTIDNWSTDAETAVKKMISDKQSGVEVIESIHT